MNYSKFYEDNKKKLKELEEEEQQRKEREAQERWERVRKTLHDLDGSGVPLEIESKLSSIKEELERKKEEEDSEKVKYKYGTSFTEMDIKAMLRQIKRSW